MKRTTIALALIATLASAATSDARTTQVQPLPISIPQALQHARDACPNDATPVQCRSALRKAYDAVSWQRSAREHAQAMTVQAITRDAITWAAAKYHVSAPDMTAVSNCESHLWPFATNGQYKGAWQLGAMHLSDPIFLRVPWQDVYAQASHVARFVKVHGWSAWQCRPQGGLRW